MSSRNEQPSNSSGSTRLKLNINGSSDTTGETKSTGPKPSKRKRRGKKGRKKTGKVEGIAKETGGGFVSAGSAVYNFAPTFIPALTDDRATLLGISATIGLVVAGVKGTQKAREFEERQREIDRNVQARINSENHVDTLTQVAELGDAIKKDLEQINAETLDRERVTDRQAQLLTRKDIDIAKLQRENKRKDGLIKRQNNKIKDLEAKIANLENQLATKPPSKEAQTQQRVAARDQAILEERMRLAAAQVKQRKKSTAQGMPGAPVSSAQVQKPAEPSQEEQKQNQLIQEIEENEELELKRNEEAEEKKAQDEENQRLQEEKAKFEKLEADRSAFQASVNEEFKRVNLKKIVEETQDLRQEIQDSKEHQSTHEYHYGKSEIVDIGDAVIGAGIGATLFATPALGYIFELGGSSLVANPAAYIVVVLAAFAVCIYAGRSKTKDIKIDQDIENDYNDTQANEEDSQRIAKNNLMPSLAKAKDTSQAIKERVVPLSKIFPAQFIETLKNQDSKSVERLETTTIKASLLSPDTIMALELSIVQDWILESLKSSTSDKSKLINSMLFGLKIDELQLKILQDKHVQEAIRTKSMTVGEVLESKISEPTIKALQDPLVKKAIQMRVITVKEIIQSLDLNKTLEKVKEAFPKKPPAPKKRCSGWFSLFSSDTDADKEQSFSEVSSVDSSDKMSPVASPTDHKIEMPGTTLAPLGDAKDQVQLYNASASGPASTVGAMFTSTAAALQSNEVDALPGVVPPASP